MSNFGPLRSSRGERRQDNNVAHGQRGHLSDSDQYVTKAEDRNVRNKPLPRESSGRG